MAHERNSVDGLGKAPVPRTLAGLTADEGIAEAEKIEQYRQDDEQRQQAARTRFDRQLTAWVESDTAPAHKTPDTRPAGTRAAARRGPRARRVRSSRAGPRSSDDSDSDGDGPGEPPAAPSWRRFVVDSHFCVVSLEVVA